MTSLHEADPVGGLELPSRRRFIGTAFVGALAVNLGLSWLKPALAADQVVATTAPPAFLDVSQKLCGRGHLEPGLASRLYRALATAHPDMPAQLKQLADVMAQPGFDVNSLQASLDAARPAYAALPRAIVSAWYTGVVGEGENAHCVAYEEALMNVTVADQLKPPSYAYGNYGSWARQPAAT
jgi:hypothetical protein